MNLDFRENSVALIGKLDENVTLESIQKRLMAWATSLRQNDPIRVDFSAVTRSNSAGILTWSRAIESASRTVCYTSAPRWLIDQINMRSDMTSCPFYVESFFAPYINSKTDLPSEVILHVGKDFPIKAAYEPQDLVLNQGAVTLIPDFDPDEYLHFIISNIDFYKGKL